MNSNLKFQYRFCLLLIAYCLLSSCGNSEFDGFEKSDSGLYYKFHIKGNDTVHPHYDEVVTVKFRKRMGDSVMESTDVLNPDGIDQYLRKPPFHGAVEEGILIMSIGDSATFLISTDSINKYYPAQDSTKNFKPHQYLSLDIKLTNIKTQELILWEQEQKLKQYISDKKEKEPVELNQYLTDNHIEVKPAANGLYFIEKEKGKGNYPKDGDSVVVHYTGAFLNGTIFDSSVKRNQPFGFVVNAPGARGVIPGWNEAIKKMKKGAASEIILPSSLAYDSAGVINPRNGKYFIPPYSPLRFEIQLINIISKK